MKFVWNDDSIKFMSSASEYSNYHITLASRISGYVKAGARICDVGCGLGYLSLALASYGYDVTALDCSPDALAVLKANLSKKPELKVSLVEDNISTHNPKAPYDALVFCFFGYIEQVVKMARNHCSGISIMICKENSYKSPVNSKLACKTSKTMAEYLNEEKIDYTFERFSVSFDQPLNDLDEAVRYFNLYGDTPEQEIKSLLRPCRYGTSKYVLPIEKNLGMITFRS